MNRFKLYIGALIFLAGWWWLAFGLGHPRTMIFAHPRTGILETTPDTHSPYESLPLAYTDRQTLHNVLAGDLSSVPELVTRWDIDAQILQSSGLSSVKRLSPEKLLAIHTLSRQLTTIDSTTQLSEVIDDAGQHIPIDPQHPYRRFLPQTYVAASFLMALVSPDQIVGLPKHLREQTELYPKAVTDKIPLDIDRYNGEKLFRRNAEIAFVAHYSHPATVQALEGQGIKLYTMRNPKTLDDITYEIVQTGILVDRRKQANLLSLFIEAAMTAIDNRLILLGAQYDFNGTVFPKILFLNYHHTYSIPTKKTLSGQLILRLNTLHFPIARVAEIENSDEWMIPISKEEISNLKPESLVITAEHPNFATQEIYSDPSLKDLPALKNYRLSFLNEAIQHSPSQYIVLAYYDLAETLINLP